MCVCVGKVFPQLECINRFSFDFLAVWQIMSYGRNTFMGYLFNEEKTREVFDGEGWLHSGDLGRMEVRCHGHLQLTVLFAS